jgi:hypothetical protein
MTWSALLPSNRPTGNYWSGIDERLTNGSETIRQLVFDRARDPLPRARECERAAGEA